MSAQLLIILLLAAVVALLAVLLRRQAGRLGRASTRRNARAQRGEHTAEGLLRRAGFEVLDRQVRGWAPMSLDGEEIEVEVRVDLSVRRGRHRYVAEVKTGERAPDPTLPATRRQLLEYSRAFPDHRLLLVDAEAGQIQEIGFPPV